MADEPNDALARINAKLNQLMGQNVAQGVMLQTLLGMHATASSDWRDTIDNLRLMAEWTVKNLEWDGPALEGDLIRAEALAYLGPTLDALHAALLREERGDPRPDMDSNPPSS